MTIQGIGTHIKVSNFQTSKTFYEALGFNKVFEIGPDKTFQKDQQGNLTSAPEDYRAVDYKHGTARLEIADGHRAVKPEVFKEKITSSKISLMVNVDSIREIIELCSKANIPLAVGPRHYYWGTLEVVVKDPDGLILIFIAPYSSEEAQKVNADESMATPPNPSK